MGIDDDYFELGGDSLTAEVLFARIETTFGRRLPLALLFQHGTVRRLATLLGESKRDTESRFASVLELQPGGERRPLFIMPAIGGQLIFSKKLMDELGTRSPLLGLQTELVPENLQQIRDFRTMAGHLVTALQEYQSHGPYALAGFSYGGLLHMKSPASWSKLARPSTCWR